jgi:hypothetical protein
MFHIVGTVESGITGEDLSLDELNQIQTWGLVNHKKSHLFLQNYEILLTFARKIRENSDGRDEYQDEFNESMAVGSPSEDTFRCCGTCDDRTGIGLYGRETAV